MAHILFNVKSNQALFHNFPHIYYTLVTMLTRWSTATFGYFYVALERET